MYKIATNKEREALFINTASKMGIDSAIVEKDFWVCLTLDYLFHHSQWKSSFAFKGGTSLSKVYNLIERFSEDIDLILDWRVIGYSENEPWEKRSNTKQQKFIEDSRKRLFKYLADEFLPGFKSDMEKLLNQELHIFINEDDPGTINFEYPSFF
ncbi:MAG: nucleotidyl transferase AbiEii/AbiGii toxin family protein [Bacilli bacterium]